MGDQLKIFCVNTGRYIDVSGGETLLDIARRIPLGFKPVCARVNNKTENLRFPVFFPKQVEYLSRGNSSGHRTYIRSLCMILYKAVQTLWPQSRLRIAHAVSRGYYCQLTGEGVEITPETVAAIKGEMQKIIDSKLPFEYNERLTSDVIEIFRRQHLDSKVLLLETIHQLYTVYYSLDGLCDSYYGTLAPNTGMIDIFDLQPYKEGMLLRGVAPENPDSLPQVIEQEKMFQAFTNYNRFNEILGVRNVGELNRAIENNTTATLINLAEALHDKYISRISDDIAARYDDGGARIVLIAGPSSSGKTTTTKRLAIQLMTNLLKPQMISLDDYFVDRDKTPLDADGEHDFESIYALDLEQFNTDLTAILQGREVSLPTYNFQTGKREYRGKTIKLDPRGILLIEGIHGLNPELTASIPEKMKYRVYVSALTTLAIDDHNWVPTTDNRLLRRIVRDHKYRGTSATDTIKRWPSVRRGEEKWIFPFQENADAMFNSSLLFELSVIKPYGEEILRQVPHDVPEYGEAYRLLKFLSYFTPIRPENIPSTSLLREFLGGSSFKY